MFPLRKRGEGALSGINNSKRLSQIQKAGFLQGLSETAFSYSLAADTATSGFGGQIFSVGRETTVAWHRVFTLEQGTIALLETVLR